MVDDIIQPEVTNRSEQEKGPEQKTVEFEVAGQNLEGLIVKAGMDGPFNILLLGGGGNIPYQEYYAAWQTQLASIGVNSMSFDFRGVGASDRELGETSLDTRLEDAIAAMKLLQQEGPDRKLYVAGVSMGGTIAIQLANAVGADGLVLVAPAAYSEEARHKQFGPEFTAALRKEGSWEDSPDFSELEQFDGKLLLAYGEEDTVIPDAILHRYTDIAMQKGRVLVLPSVGHRFMREGDPASLAARDEVQASLEMLAA
jgi:pimeloyl-ACP methyl ester carboxylesterase